MSDDDGWGDLDNQDDGGWPDDNNENNMEVDVNTEIENKMYMA